MPDDFLTRAQLVKNRMDRLGDEATRISREVRRLDRDNPEDLERMEKAVERLNAINLETDLCLDAMRTLREEQLVAFMQETEPEPPKRKWWKFW